MQISFTHSRREASAQQGRSIKVKVSQIATDFQNHQLSLFQGFLCNTDDERQKLSNSIELWDAVPRYSTSRRAMVKMRDEHGNLPLLQLQFEYRGTKFSVSIQATQIEVKDKNGKLKKTWDGKPVTIAYYPSANEELVEEALRKLAVNQKSGFYVDEKPKARSGVSFTLYQLRNELKQRGHTRSFDEITLSLDILSGSNINIIAYSPTSIDMPFGKSNYLAAMTGVTRKDMISDPNKKWMVQFHPFVTASIDKLSYRQFNYHQLMSHTTQLARWLHKQLILKYTFASRLHPFEMRYSTIQRDSAMLDNYSRPIDARVACESSMNELKEHGVLMGLTRRVEEGVRGKITDVVYTLTPSSEFVAEAKAANKRKEKLSTIDK